MSTFLWWLPRVVICWLVLCGLVTGLWIWVCDRADEDVWDEPECCEFHAITRRLSDEAGRASRGQSETQR